MNRLLSSLYIWSLALCLSLSGMLSSCADQDYEAMSSQDDSQPIATEVSLSLASLSMEQKTRAAISENADSKIYNLWIYVFDEQGKDGQLFRYQNPKDSVSFTIKSGKRRIYALANVGDSESLVTYSHDLSAIKDVKTLELAMATLNTQTVFRNSGHLVMSGTYKETPASANDGLCVIKPVGHYKLPQPLFLQRIDARITFNISIDPDDPEASNKKFIPQSWQVFNAPASGVLFSQDTLKSEKYFSMDKALQFENLENDPATGLSHSTFTFYTLENNQKGTGATTWSDREMKEKDSDGINTRVFKHAPQNATYVKIRGQYSYDYTDEKSGHPAHQNAYVEYTVHLGYVGDDAYNNYECKRNTSYTYNVLVRGVDDIILKVETENNPEQPDQSSDIGNGGEGDVVVATYFYDFDAHYDRTIIRFSQKNIQEHPELQGFYVQTPFNEGAYYIEGLETAFNGSKPASEAIDYDWIKFRRCDMKSDSIYNSTSYSYYDPDNVFDIKQLIKDLRSGKDQKGFSVYDRNGEAYYTLFVEENYYTRNPKTGEKGEIDFWKQFVNQKPREMYIFCQNNTTLDKQSSLTNGYIQIRQRAIHTHYNTNASSALQTAWGVETRNETGQVRAEIINPWEAVGFTSDNAILNQKIQFDLVGQSWYRYLSTDVNEEDYSNQLNDNSMYSTFLYACVQRNRDENGNGIIDQEELKWIPAASRHYNELWIGNSSLPNDVRLFPMGSRDNHRYLSSNGEEFVAEEGGSYAPYGSLANTSYLDAARPSLYDYRCIRLLGYDTYTSDDLLPQSFIRIDGDKHQISLSWLDEQSRRTPDFSLDSSNEEAADQNSYLNYPYETFAYRDVDVTTDTIPAGWRLPNDREMAIMMLCLQDGWGNPTEKTFYPTSTLAAPYLTGKAGCVHHGVCDPQASGITLRYMQLPTSVTNKKIRCVKDVK